MRSSAQLWCAIVLAAGCGSPEKSRHSVPASSESGVIALHNGPNEVNLLGDGTEAQVFVAWRGNYNAHGFSTISFYLRAKGDVEDSTVWQVAPFFGGPHDRADGRNELATEEGADCTLADLRVIARHHAPAEVVFAIRELGSSFADSAIVRFEYYTLQRNTDGLVGTPPFHFEHSRTVLAKRLYCDVNEAFRAELGLGATGLGHGEAER